MSMLFVVIAVVVVFLYSIFITIGGFGNSIVMELPNYIDLPSLLLILLWTIPVLIGAGMFKDFRKAFSRAFSVKTVCTRKAEPMDGAKLVFGAFSVKTVCTREELMRSMEAVQLAQRANWVAGLLGFLTAFVSICKRFGEIGAEIFMLNVAVAVITLIYAAIINLILLAVYGRLKKRYIEYMQGE